TRSADIRLSGLHPLLGPKPARRMGGQAQDGEEPTQARVCSAVGLVSRESAPSDQGAAPEARREAARPLRVLREYRELLQPPEVRGGYTEDLETLAVAAQPGQSDAVVRIPSAGAVLHSSPCPSGPWSLARRSEVMLTRNRMRDMCTSGSEGGLGGQPP